MNPPSNSHALSQPFMAARLLQNARTTSLPSKADDSLSKKDEVTEKLEKMPNKSTTEPEIKPDTLEPEIDKSVSENNEFQELLDIIYENKPINIVYGKDRRTQITPAILTGKKDVIYEHEIPSIVRKSSEEGYKDMLELNYKAAMINFKKSENIINTYMSNNGKLHQDYIVHTFVNQGICLYKFGFLEESLALFEKSILTLKNPSKNKPLHYNANLNPTGNNNEYFNELTNKLKYKRIRCGLHMQCCLILSEAEKHEEALIHSKHAIRLAFKILIDTISICYHLFLHNKKTAEAGDSKNQNSSTNNRASFKIKTKEAKAKKSKEVKSEATLKESPDDEGAINNDELIQPLSFKQIDENHLIPSLNDLYNNDYIVKLLPILYELLKRTQDVKKDLVSDKKEFIINVLKKACGEGMVLEDPNVRVIFDSIDPYLHRLYRCNILTLLQMQPLNFAELAQTTEINEEIYPEIILNKIGTLALSFYCASTEIRFMEEKDYDMKKISPILDMDSEYWLGRSLETAYVFMPNDMPFVIQIISVFCRLHLATKQIIPEDEPMNDCYKLILPLKGGVKTSFFIPLVKIKSTMQNKEPSKQNSHQTNNEKSSKTIKPNSNNLKLFLRNSQQPENMQTNAVFPKKLSNSLGQKKQESLTNLERIYMSRINIPKNPQMQPVCQSYKPAEEPFLKKISIKPPESQAKKSSFVSKLKSKMKRSNTPGNIGIEEFNPSKSYKNVYNNKATLKRSSSTKTQKKSDKINNPASDAEFVVKRNNNFVVSNSEATTSSIELKNIQNLGIQINNNINVIINQNPSQSQSDIVKPLTNELSNNNNLNGLINTRIMINGKKMKNSTGFMSKSKQKFNKINEVMMAMANERKGSNKDEKIIIFPTDYLKTLSLKEKSRSEIPRGRENNFLMKETLSKSHNNLEIK